MEPLLDADLAQSPSTFDIRDNRERARVVQIVFGAIFFISVLSIFSGYMQLSLLQTMSSGGEWTEDAASQNDLRQGIVGLLQFSALIAGAVFFIRWFRRAYHNLHETNLYMLKHTEGWAAGAWFVPIINLFYPYQIMKEVWDNTQRAYTREIEPSGLVTGWWIFWIIGNMISNTSFRMSMKSSDTVEGLISTTQADMASSVFDLIAVVLAILMVRQTSGFEQLFYEHFQRGGTGLADSASPEEAPAGEETTPAEGE